MKQEDKAYVATVTYDADTTFKNKYTAPAVPTPEPSKPQKILPNTGTSPQPSKPQKIYQTQVSITTCEYNAYGNCSCNDCFRICLYKQKEN